MSEKMFLEQVKRIIDSTPNDQELGEKIRKLFESLKTNN
jgi:hypothetical protein